MCNICNQLFIIPLHIDPTRSWQRLVLNAYKGRSPVPDRHSPEEPRDVRRHRAPLSPSPQNAEKNKTITKYELSGAPAAHAPPTPANNSPALPMSTPHPSHFRRLSICSLAPAGHSPRTDQSGNITLPFLPHACEASLPRSKPLHPLGGSYSKCHGSSLGDDKAHDVGKTSIC